jgi:hypothetical protein
MRKRTQFSRMFRFSIAFLTPVTLTIAFSTLVISPGVALLGVIFTNHHFQVAALSMQFLNVAR